MKTEFIALQPSARLLIGERQVHCDNFLVLADEAVLFSMVDKLSSTSEGYASNALKCAKCALDIHSYLPLQQYVTKYTKY
jgi:hypothetical protein